MKAHAEDVFTDSKRVIVTNMSAMPENLISPNSRPILTVGDLMEPPHAVFFPSTTVAQAIEELRELVTRNFITYSFVADEDGRLQGVVTMRELLFSAPNAELQSVMVPKPFFLTANTGLLDAMRQAVGKHFPIYPVCDDDRRLVGLVRGPKLFEVQAIEISAQAGQMVGVEKEERLSTPWSRSLRWRHPWLQINLLTAFIAGAVVSVFQNTIDQIVLLAAFLPVLAGQSGNTGCQALAVTLRGLTLGDLKNGSEKQLIAKEAWLGCLNGLLVGIVAGMGMYAFAFYQGNPLAAGLGLITLFAMIGSCLISGVFGAIVPIALKRLGYDPATASSIFLTTATDVASMGLFLLLATLFLL